MARPLLKDRTLEGMSREEVAQMLGSPTQTDKFADWDTVYVLGPNVIDYQWLLIRFTGDMVGEAAVRSD